MTKEKWTNPCHPEDEGEGGRRGGAETEERGEGKACTEGDQGTGNKKMSQLERVTGKILKSLGHLRQGAGGSKGNADIRKKKPHIQVLRAGRWAVGQKKSAAALHLEAGKEKSGDENREIKIRAAYAACEVLALMGATAQSQKSKTGRLKTCAARSPDPCGPWERKGKPETARSRGKAENRLGEGY